MRLRIVLLVMLFLFTAVIANAEMRSGFEMGLFGGSASAGAGIQKSIDDGFRKISTNVEDGSLYGLRMGGNFNRYFGLEIALANAETQYNAYLFDRNNESLSSAENTSIGLLYGNVLLHFPIGPIVPFVTGGAGWALFMDYSLPEINYGVGAKIFLSKRFFLRFDFKEHIISGSQEIQEAVYYRGDIYEVPYSFEEEIHLREISGGVSILF